MAAIITVPAFDTTWITRVDPAGIAACRVDASGTAYGYSGGEKLNAIQYQQTGGVATITRLLLTIDFAHSTIPWGLMDAADLDLYVHGYALAEVSAVQLWASSHKDTPDLADYSAFTGTTPIASVTTWNTEGHNKFSIPLAQYRDIVALGGKLKLMLRAAGDGANTAPPVAASSGAILLDHDSQAQRPFIRVRHTPPNPIVLAAERTFKSGTLENASYAWQSPALDAPLQAITPADLITHLPGHAEIPLVWEQRHNRIEAKPIGNWYQHSEGEEGIDLFAVMWARQTSSGEGGQTRPTLYTVAINRANGSYNNITLSDSNDWIYNTWPATGEQGWARSWGWDASPNGIVVVVQSNLWMTGWFGAVVNCVIFRRGTGWDEGRWVHVPGNGVQITNELDRRVEVPIAENNWNTYQQVMDVAYAGGSGESASDKAYFRVYYSIATNIGLKGGHLRVRTVSVWKVDGSYTWSVGGESAVISGNPEVTGGFTAVTGCARISTTGTIQSEYVVCCETAGVSPIPEGKSVRGLILLTTYDGGATYFPVQSQSTGLYPDLYDVPHARALLLRGHSNPAGGNWPDCAIVRLPCTFFVLSNYPGTAVTIWWRGPSLGIPTPTIGTMAQVSHDLFILLYQEVGQTDPVGGATSSKFLAQLYQALPFDEPARPADCSGEYRWASNNAKAVWPEPLLVSEILRDGSLFTYHALAASVAMAQGSNVALALALQGDASGAIITAAIRVLYRDPNAVSTLAQDDKGDAFLETATPMVGVANDWQGASFKRRVMLAFDLAGIPESIRNQVQSVHLRLTGVIVETTTNSATLAVVASDFQNHDQEPEDYAKVGTVLYYSGAVTSGTLELDLGKAALEAIRANNRLALALLNDAFDRTTSILAQGAHSAITFQGPGSGHATAPRLLLTIREHAPTSFVHRIPRDDCTQFGWYWYRGACHPRLPTTQAECELAGHQWVNGACVDLGTFDQGECEQGGFTWIGTKCQASAAIGMIDCACIDRVTNTWIVAAHQVDAVLEVFSTTPDSDQTLVRRFSGFEVSTLAHAIGLDGLVTVITFHDEPPHPETGKVSVNVRGMTAGGVLIENPVAILEHFITHYWGMTAADYDLDGMVTEASQSDAWGYKAAGVIRQETTPQQVVTELARSFYGVVFFNEAGQFAFRFQEV